MQRENTAHDHVVERFVHDIAEHLHRARAAGTFDDLILVAEPKLLGSLRHALDKPTAHKVVASMTKDLAEVPAAQVAQHIEDVLPL